MIQSSRIKACQCYRVAGVMAARVGVRTTSPTADQTISLLMERGPLAEADCGNSVTSSMNCRSLSPLPPRCIVSSKWKPILQAARFWKERAESYVALWHGSERHHGICGHCCGRTFNPQQPYEAPYQNSPMSNVVASLSVSCASRMRQSPKWRHPCRRLFAGGGANAGAT